MRYTPLNKKNTQDLCDLALEFTLRTFVRTRRGPLLGLCWAASIGVLLSATTATAAGQLEIGRSDEWRFNVTPYVWFAGVDGDVTLGGTTSEVDLDYKDIFENIDYGAIGHFEATKGPWAIMTDIVYLKVSEDADVPVPTISNIEVETESLILEVGAGYRVYETDSNFVNRPMSLSVLGGVRYTHLDLDVDITATPAIAGGSGSKDWVDPFVGFRSTIQWTRRWSSSLRFDIGGFGAGSDLVYQIVTTQRIELNDRFDLVFGLRRLDYDYEDGSGASKFEFDTTISGPFIGTTIKF